MSSAEISVAGQSPVALTSFVGRRRATAEVKHALSASRLVTLTGPVGVGKSRLAVHVAREVRRAFPDGVWFVELAKLSDPALVGHAVAATLNVPGRSSREPASVLADFLAAKHLLLVIDNCEHLLESIAELVIRLLTAVPKLFVLATSREPLLVGGERVWPVPPLAVPSADGEPGMTTGQHEALELFEDRRSRSCRISPWMRTTGRPWHSCAGGWTACRWRSNWPRSGCG
jgi:predicted ATPase